MTEATNKLQEAYNTVSEAPWQEADEKLKSAFFELSKGGPKLVNDATLARKLNHFLSDPELPTAEKDRLQADLNAVNQDAKNIINAYQPQPTMEK